MKRGHLKLVKAPPSLHELRALASIYLATSYTNHPAGLDAAHHDAMALAVRLRAQKVYVYSPIMHWHDAAFYFDLPVAARDWREENEYRLRYASAVLVGETPGWETSDGVQSEIEYARAWNKALYFIHPETLELRQ